MAEIYQVSPWKVFLGDQDIRPRDVAVQKARLESEGQIEPIEVKHRPDMSSEMPYQLDRNGWVYAGTQVAAARELDWPTILVTY